MEKWFCIWDISDNPKIIALFSPTIAYKQYVLGYFNETLNKQ